MRTGTYGEFSRMVHDQVADAWTPVDGTIEVTHRCPLACVHCYNGVPTGDAVARGGELTLDEHRRIVDEIAEAGCLWLLYTGGEIFARGDFLSIYRHAIRAGLLVTLFTNGLLLNETIADVLGEIRPFAVEITVYGATAPTHDAVTGLPGSFGRCLRGIELLRERGIPLRLKTMALSANRHEIFEMKRMAGRLGLEFRFDAMINPRIDGGAGPLRFRLAPAEAVRLDLEEPERIGEFARLASEGPPPARDGALPALYDCGAGVHSFAIDPYGKLTGCTLSKSDPYDLRSGSFREGWEVLRTARTRSARRVTKCTLCALRSMCGTCPAYGELETGDPESPVEFLCETAHLRAEVFGIPVPAHGDCEHCGAGRGRLLEAAGRISRAPAAVAALPAAGSSPGPGPPPVRSVCANRSR